MRRLLFLFLLAGASFADSNLSSAIGWLKSAQDPATGEINHYGVWGTAWGTIALAQYGENESTLNKSLGYISNSQNNDGGIPYELGSPWGSGVDYSAPAILAFAYANRTPYSMKNNNRTPMDFIWGTQGANGGFGEWGEDTVSTSLAVIALSTIGENITRTGKDPAAFILSKQNSTDGGFDWWTKSEATAQALIALNNVGIDDQSTTAGLNYLKSIQNTTTGRIVDPYVTALSALAFHSYGWDHENSMAVSYLKSVQNESGRIGRTNETQASDAFTTALSALAFSNFTFTSKVNASLSCSFTALLLNETQTCTLSLSQLGNTSYRYSLDGVSSYSNSPSISFSGFSSGRHNVSASAFGTSQRLVFSTNLLHFNFTVPGLESPLQNSAYNLGDVVEVRASNAENLSAFFNGSGLNGTLDNSVYSSRIENLTIGNYSIYFNLSGFSEYRNFTVSDRYTVQITNPGGCTIGSASQIAFSVLGANGVAVTTASVFACLNGNCAQTDGSSYQYTCTGTNSFYVNASRNGNFGSAQIEFSGTSPSSGGGGSYVTVEIEFPPNAGRHDISRVLNYGECEYAYDCFSKVASLDCGWFSAGGALACPGSTVSRTCLATGVDGIKASSGGWWSFYTNGGLSAWGISCYKVNNGDKVKLKYAGEYKVESPPAPQPNSGTGSAAASPAPEKNRTAPPKETPAHKPVIIESGGFKMEENIGTALVSSARKSKATIVSGANAPCPTCDFASALLLKSGLDGMDISTEVTTDDRVRECGGKEIVIFVGGPAANRGVPASYLNVTGSADGAIYNITQNCFVVAGNTRELTNKAVSALMETFK